MNFNEFDHIFIIAEIGVNHEGDFEQAQNLIRKAASCKVDAVKLQNYYPEEYISIEQTERRARSEKFFLSPDNLDFLANLAQELGVLFFSTPLSPKAADDIEEIVPFYKISSGDITYSKLISHIAKKRKPIIVSTGLGLQSEIENAVNLIFAEYPTIAEEGNLMLMHCVSAYPTPEVEANLANISWLQKEFGLPVGYSDHTLGTKACELAVTAGAVALEKHFTYRKENQDFHDHALSADEVDMKKLVVAVRKAEVLMGVPGVERTASELELMPQMRRSIAAATDIPANTSVRSEWISYLRPAWGLQPHEINKVVGNKLNRDLRAGEIIRNEDLLDRLDDEIKV